MDLAASSTALAQRFIEGQHAEVMEILTETGADLSYETAARIGTALQDDARTHWNVWPRERTWADHQAALLDLSRLPGVDFRGLAECVIDACMWQRIDGFGTPLETATFDWMMRSASDHVHGVVREHLPHNTGSPLGVRFLVAGLWTFPGADALQWMVDYYRTQPGFANFRYEDMRLGYLRSSWSPEDWSRRVHALCEARLDGAPLYVDSALDRATSAAQVRLACTYASSATDHLLRTVADNVRSYRTGDPTDDLDLVFWDVPDAALEFLRSLLEVAGEAGTRAPLVRCAAAAGRIDARRASELSAPIDRPPWMDGPVPWEVEEVVDAGIVRVPEGRLSATDPYWAFEGVPFELEVKAGSYPVRVTVATHPFAGRGCAVAELVLAHEPATLWERLGERPHPDEFGYRVEVGVGSFGPVVALTERFHDCAPPDFPGQKTLHAEVDTGDDGSIVMFRVLPQHQLCRTWLGRTTDGTPARIVSDLGLLHLDPEANPHAPMTPGDPPPEPEYEHVPHPLETQTGVTRGRYRSVNEEITETVTVLDISPAELSWLHTDAVWFRWDQQRIGEVLPAADFRARFELA